ncbi:MAG: DUF4192 domain-containing protein [Beutenbergiaceae bacterium]
MEDLFDTQVKLDPRNPIDLLSYLPYRFGYPPTQSLVVLMLGRPAPGRWCLGPADRLDLADLAHPATLTAAREGVAMQVRQLPMAQTMTVIYSDEPIASIRAGDALAGTVLAQWLQACEFADPACAWIVTPECYGPLHPGAGIDTRPARELAESAVAAQMVLAGQVLAGSRAELASPRQCDPQRRAQATRAAARARRSYRRRPAPQRGPWRERMLDQFGQACAVAAGRRPESSIDAPLLGRLGAALEDAMLREAILVWSLTGEPLTPDTIAVLDAIERVVTGGGRLPSAQHLSVATTVLTQIVQHSARNRAGQPLAILAWLAWWRGDGVRANVLLTQCLREETGIPLAHLLHQVLDAAVAPGWFQSDASGSPSSR